MCSVISGVPQNSVLGTVLFIIFVNDITCCMSDNVNVKLFADDAKTYAVINGQHICAWPVLNGRYEFSAE